MGSKKSQPLLEGSKGCKQPISKPPPKKKGIEAAPSNLRSKGFVCIHEDGTIREVVR